MDMLLNSSVKLEGVARLCKLSVSTVCRLRKKYNKGPDEVTLEIENDLKAQPFFIEAEKLALTSKLRSLNPSPTNKSTLMKMLREVLAIKDNTKNYQLLAKAKEEINLCKRKPKITKGSNKIVYNHHDYDFVLATTSLFLLFYGDESMMIFATPAPSKTKR